MRGSKLWWNFTHLQIRYGEGEVPLCEGLAADVHLPLQEEWPVAALLPRSVHVHQAVSSIVLDPRGLAVPVDHLGAVGANTVFFDLLTTTTGHQWKPMMTHLLVLFLFRPVSPHVSAINARQHYRAPDQNHVHRLLPVPEALLLATYDPEQQRLCRNQNDGGEPVLPHVLRT